MIRRFCFTAVSALLISACAGHAATEAPDVGNTDADNVRFSDILAEYQALNTRLENVSAPLLKANAALCPRTARDIGITVHTVSDYPPQLQAVAASLLGVDSGLSVRTVRQGSAAENAGVSPHDQLMRIGNRSLQRNVSSQLYYTAVSQSEFKKDSVTIDMLRDDTALQVEVTPETICGYPVIVFFNEHVNGHTDGREVWITSELMRTVPDDVNLALIIAHEMSHAIAGHMQETPSKALELEADRMALVLMARAGYDIERAVNYWQDAAHPHRAYQTSSKTHPTIDERLTNFQKSLKQIKRQQASGGALTFAP